MTFLEVRNQISYATWRVFEDLKQNDDEWLDSAWEAFERADGNKEEASGSLGDWMYESYELPPGDPFWRDLLIDALDNVDWIWCANQFISRIENDWIEENGGDA